MKALISCTRDLHNDDAVSAGCEFEKFWRQAAQPVLLISRMKSKCTGLRGSGDIAAMLTRTILLMLQQDGKMFDLLSDADGQTR